jgi:hypothetical protein
VRAAHPEWKKGNSTGAIKNQMVNCIDDEPRRGFNTQATGVYCQVVMEGIRPVHIVKDFEVFGRGPVMFKDSGLSDGRPNILALLQTMASNIQRSFDTHVENVELVGENNLPPSTDDYHIAVFIGCSDGTLDQGQALGFIQGGNRGMNFPE